jgi:hypothetical protein
MEKLEDLKKMATFPTIGELLLPNFNGATIIGTILLAIGITMLYFGVKIKRTRTIRILLGDFSPIKYGWFLIGIGILLVWGVSIITDFVTSIGGQIVTFGLIFLSLLWFILFYEPKKGRKSKFTF